MKKKIGMVAGGTGITPMLQVTLPGLDAHSLRTMCNNYHPSGSALLIAILPDWRTPHSWLPMQHSALAHSRFLLPLVAASPTDRWKAISDGNLRRSACRRRHFVQCLWLAVICATARNPAT